MNANADLAALHPAMPWRRVLIANRGEVAVRIIRAVHSLGLESVAVYADCDSQSLHVKRATHAVLIGGAQAYTDIGKLVAVATEHACDAVHPGYGFVSEDFKAAEEFGKAGIVWIGPTKDVIKMFGKKHTAREIARKVGVPIIPGSGLMTDEEMCVKEAAALGYPVVVKATAGGGGMGQSICFGKEGTRRAWRSCVAQARGLFGDERVYIEKYVEHARHIEIQIFGDGKGKVVALGERDCSVQRRRQKIIEESPSPHVSSSLRRRMVRAAVDLCSSVKYLNAGTVEFIADAQSEEFYFLEVNSRLQVEHGVTEMVTGIDIVVWMLRQAAGQDIFAEIDIPHTQTISPVGHAFECRIYAENPLKGYRPCPGILRQMEWPAESTRENGSAKIRVDTWTQTGSVISSHFDPLVGKLLVWGKTRKSAIQDLRRALKQVIIRGVDSNVALLRRVCEDRDFVQGEYTTGLLEFIDHTEPVVEVISPGLQTSLQDYPGRLGYWDVGVSPSGAMDSYAMVLGNALLGNELGACAMEITVRGPVLKFYVTTTIVLTGARLFAEIDDGKPVPWWTPIPVAAGSVLTLEGLDEAVSEEDEVPVSGKIAYLAVRGGFDAPKYLGSTSTFPTGHFGGVHGRFLQSGDFLPLEEDHYSESVRWSGPLESWVIPHYPNHWIVGALNGPHGSTEFLHESSLTEIWTCAYRVHHAANRLGVRLIGPTPKWTRTDGGSAGLHPSNLHDFTYAPGAVNFSGNTAIVLMNDGPSLGGFICPITVATSELWKVAQARPGDKITFKEVPYDLARDSSLNTGRVAEAVQAADKVALEEVRHTWHPWWVKECTPVSLSATVATIDESDMVKVVYRMSGDTHILVEYGEIELDFEYRLRVHLAMEHLKKEPFVLELCPGVRSLLIKYDSDKIHYKKLVSFLKDMELTKLKSVEDVEVPSRLIRLPLAFNDQWTNEAQARYRRSVRAAAPYLPSNVEFVRRINGLESLDAVSKIISSAEYMVMGLGDVYLGAPCAVPVDPRHRMVTSKYNPARTYTPEGAVGIGGAYMCIYGMSSPGGYQLVGRTLPIWDNYGSIPETHRGALPSKPWLLKFFDRVQFYLVSDSKLEILRERYRRGDLIVDIKPGTFSFAAYKKFLAENCASIERFVSRQKAAFNSERAAWAADGEDADNKTNGEQPNMARTLSEAMRLEMLKEAEEQETKSFSVDVVASVAATVWAVEVKNGQSVSKGDTIAVLESMKVEIDVLAPIDGVVKNLAVHQGLSVFADTRICRVVAGEKELMSSLEISTLSKLYKLAVIDPEKLVLKLHDRIASDAKLMPSVFTTVIAKETLVERARYLKKLKRKKHLPLYGIPFVVKDNIDVKGLPTTAGCPLYSYNPDQSAYCVSLLESAGAILIAKTNMDQFATGIVGCRSPYGTPENPKAPGYIPGGSSSGSAVAVAMHLCSFSLGTDTAGSGRVPAAMNGIIGLKPTKGRISTVGVVPACPSLDCVSIFASSVSDAEKVLKCLDGYNEDDPWSRLPPLLEFSDDEIGAQRNGSGMSFGNWEAKIRIGVPKADQLEFCGDAVSQKVFETAIRDLETVKCTVHDVDWSSFQKAGDMLYGGPFVAERYASVGEFLEKVKDKTGVDPAVAEIILNGKKHTAASVFKAQQAINRLKKQAVKDCWSFVDVLMVPSIPKPYTLEEVRQDPFGPNSRLGIYTNFVNLMDLSAVAVPASSDGDEKKVPRGVTFISLAWKEELLIDLAKRWERASKKST